MGWVREWVRVEDWEPMVLRCGHVASIHLGIPSAPVMTRPDRIRHWIHLCQCGAHVP